MAIQDIIWNIVLQFSNSAVVYEGVLRALAESSIVFPVDSIQHHGRRLALRSWQRWGYSFIPDDVAQWADFLYADCLTPVIVVVFLDKLTSEERLAEYGKWRKTAEMLWDEVSTQVGVDIAGSDML